MWRKNAELKKRRQWRLVRWPLVVALGIVVPSLGGCQPELERWCKGELTQLQSDLAGAQITLAARTGVAPPGRGLAGEVAATEMSASDLQDFAIGSLKDLQAWHDRLREQQATRPAAGEVLRAANAMVRLDGALSIEQWTEASAAVERAAQSLAKARTLVCR